MAGFKKSVLDLMFYFNPLYLSERIRAELLPRFMEMHKKLKTNYGELKYYCPNRITTWRIDTFFTKEPDMISWLDSLNENSVLYDVGANVGIYSIYAAKKVKKVYSFEPESSNYFCLNKNIFINKFKNIKAYSLAIGEKNEFLSFKKSTEEIGGALHSIVRDVNSEDNVEQSIVIMSLDSLIFDFNFPKPTHMKIDIDGHQLEVVRGALRLLKEGCVESIIIELDKNSKDDLECIQIIESYNYIKESFVHSPIEKSFQEIGNFVFRLKKA